MRDRRVELVKGTLDLLVLRTLELQPLHGAAVAERILQITAGAFDVKAGSLFPALHRLEQEGRVVGEWSVSTEGRRVKCYTLTQVGRRHLAKEAETWRRVVHAMTQVLESS